MNETVVALWDWLWNASISSGLDSLTKSVLFVLGIILLLCFVFTTLVEAFEKLAKALDILGNYGLPVLRSDKIRRDIQKRTLFLKVLHGDLRNIGLKENWNDQAFSELDAEVELEGSYYTSRLSRVYEQAVKGVRRAPSLTEAIGVTAREHLLLLGDPGSGKSVALRHLALQLAKRGMRSRSMKCKVPVYVNFRHFERNSYPNLDAISLKSFIIDQVRNDSPSSSAFLEENWNKYCELELWYFLFDSFDEIPDVLHSSDIEGKRLKYIDVLRSFAKGVGGCRVVVASREYKGPEALGWDRVKILPLSFSRKEALVRHSFLEKSAKKQILHYLSEHDGTLYDNPLFLTLLCRYVGDNGKLPETDYRLLENHVASTLAKDHQYLSRNYRLSKDEALRAATRLASIYAMNSSLGLSPTRSEIEKAINDDFLRLRLDDVLAGLVAAKVLRKDIGEASSKDVRYAFSHRRYQETLFVRYILGDDCCYAPSDLVRDSRWREYLVTLLQGQNLNVLAPYLNALFVELNTSFGTIPFNKFTYKHKQEFQYALWRNSKAAYYLGVLLDGFRGRYDILPDIFKESIAGFLANRYASGDISDQYMVVRFSILAGEKMAKIWLSEAIESSSVVLKQEAFAKVGDIKNPDLGFANFVRRRYSTQVLLSHKRYELLRTEAMLAKIAEGLRCDRVFKRVMFLRFVFGWALQLCATSRSTATKSARWWRRSARAFFGSELSVIPSLLIWLLLLNIGFAISYDWSLEVAVFSWPTFVCVALGLFASALLVMYFARDEPGHITITVILGRLKRWWTGANVKEATLALGLLALLLFVPSFLVYWIFVFFGYTGSFFGTLLLSSITLFLGLMTVLRRYGRSESIRLRLSLDEKLATKGGDSLWVILQAQSWTELLSWTGELDKMGKLKSVTLRRLFAVVAALEKDRLAPGLKQSSFIVLGNDIRNLGLAKHRLLDLYFAGLTEGDGRAIDIR